MNVPDWWEFVLLFAAAWRTFQLIARDDILDRPRAWALGYTGWQGGKAPPPPTFRAKWSEFITCPYCAGFWISGVWLAGYEITVEWLGFFGTAATWFAMSAALISIDKFAASDD